MNPSTPINSILEAVARGRLVRSSPERLPEPDAAPAVTPTEGAEGSPDAIQEGGSLSDPDLDMVSLGLPRQDSYLKGDISSWSSLDDTSHTSPKGEEPPEAKVAPATTLGDLPPADPPPVPKVSQLAPAPPRPHSERAAAKMLARAGLRCRCWSTAKTFPQVHNPAVKAKACPRMLARHAPLFLYSQLLRSNP